MIIIPLQGLKCITLGYGNKSKCFSDQLGISTREFRLDFFYEQYSNNLPFAHKGFISIDSNKTINMDGVRGGGFIGIYSISISSVVWTLPKGFWWEGGG